MEKNNIKLLVEKAVTEKNQALIDAIVILKEKRISIIHNQMNELIGIQTPEAEKNKEVITKIIKLLNEYASKNNIDFHVEEDWESIELFIKNTILDDLKVEFEKQASQQ